MDISLQLFMFYGCPFGYPWISMDIHALTCYRSSIKRTENLVTHIPRKKKYSRNAYMNTELHVSIAFD